MRLIFMGTPDFAVPTLRALSDAGHEIVAVYARVPKPADRGLEIKPTPVEREARRLGLPVLTPTTLRTDEAVATFRAHKADAAVVVAYGLILPKPILEAPRLGCFNVHASLLPRWRGAAPINRAIMAGDKKTGITIMKMDEGLDTGPIVRTKQVGIKCNMTVGELHDVLARIGAARMPMALRTANRGKAQPTPQSDQEVTYAEKISKNETRVDWTKPWDKVHNHIRGLSSFPSAWFEIAGVRIKALGSRRGRRGKKKVSPGTALDDHLTIACGDGAVRLTQVQRAGRQPMAAEEFLRGTKVEPGARLA